MMFHDRVHTIGGKVSIFTTLLGVLVILVGLVIDLPHGHVARANTATTSVTVLNTPPQWAGVNNSAQENPGSSTSTPTNVGSNVNWIATANDSSNDNYYLLICKNFASATPNAGAAPSCSGGLANQWAVSVSTVSGQQATAATTTVTSMAEFNTWWGYVCDGNATGAACNPLTTNGSGTTSSPFVVNHRPTFTVYADDSPKDPGALVTWTTTASDPDTYQGTGTDTVKLFVCKANDFTGAACGAGGTWATSTATTTNPSATTTLVNPDPDGTFPAYGFVIDIHGGFAASGGSEGSDSSLVVNNKTPTISAASVSLIDTDGAGPLTITGMATQTPGYSVQYTVTDQNSCQNTSAGPEITFGLADVYRSGVTQSGCDQSSKYDPNSCYPYGAATTSGWNISCTASTTSCLGTGDSDVIWTCTFPLWFFTQSTDGTGIGTDPQYWAQNWLASAQAVDDNGATSSLVEASSGNELNSFLAYDLSTTTIAYGGLQPGNSADLATSTSVGFKAEGNVGLDQSLFGADMCPAYPVCSGNATSTIFVNNQKFASSTMTYASAPLTLSTTPSSFALHVLKSTSTTYISSKNTYWGILVPGAITLSGDYIGVNTILGVTSPSSSW